MKLYSKVKLVRHCTELKHKPLAYHIGYVMRLGSFGSSKYADVQFKDKKRTRLIRMFYVETKDIYKYYDNDNNTVIYYQKTISETISEKSWVFQASSVGFQYEIDKIAELENITNYQFIGKIGEHVVSLVDDNVMKDKNDKLEFDRLMHRTKVMMYAHTILDGFNSPKADQLFMKLLEGYDPYLISQFLPKITEDEFRQLYHVNDLKNQCIKNQDYQNAADIRDIERKLIDYHLSKKLASKQVIKIDKLMDPSILTEVNDIVKEITELIKNFKK